MAKRQLISANDAEIATRQPTEPCGDCPFAKASLAGWLGNLSVDEWLRCAHGESVIDCHALIAEDGSAFQCAGTTPYQEGLVDGIEGSRRRVARLFTRLGIAVD